LGDFVTIILAAGKGTRMKSDLAKVLHKIHGRPMVHYVIDLAHDIGSERVILIVGHQKERAMAACKDMNVEFTVQAQQLGTGHAVRMTQPLLHDYAGDVIVLSGDVPLLTIKTLKNLVSAHQNHKAIATLLTSQLDDPSGYGRVIRNEQGEVIKIVEDKDATQSERAVKEINVGIYMFNAKELFASLQLINNDNAQGEYYLPDVVKMYVDNGRRVIAQLADKFDETRGINTLQQLHQAETILASR